MCSQLLAARGNAYATRNFCISVQDDLGPREEILRRDFAGIRAGSI
jgi:hypothetical protein